MRTCCFKKSKYFAFFFSKSNYRYLSTPEKVDRCKGLSKRNRELKVKIKCLQSKLDKTMEVGSTGLDDETSGDLEKIMEEEDETISSKFPEDSFQAIF